jgi:hypothetical protein
VKRCQIGQAGARELLALRTPIAGHSKSDAAGRDTTLLGARLTLNSVTNVTCIPWCFPSGLFCLPPRAESMYGRSSSLQTFGKSRKAAVSVLSASSDPDLNDT